MDFACSGSPRTTSTTRRLETAARTACRPGVGRIDDTLLLQEHEPVFTAGKLTLPLERRPMAHRSSMSTAAARSPGTVPDSSWGIRSSRSTADRRGGLRPRARGHDDRGLRRLRYRGGPGQGPKRGVGPGRQRPGPQDRGHRPAGRQRCLHARVRTELQQRPRAVRPDRALRDRRRTGHHDVAGGRPRDHPGRRPPCSGRPPDHRHWRRPWPPDIATTSTGDACR